MKPTNWRFTDEDNDVVVRTNDDGFMESVSINDPTIAEWFSAGGVPDPYIPAPADPCFLARELLAQLTAADRGKIRTAIAGSDALALLWDSLLAQGEAPIYASSERFQTGWSAFRKALGESRADQIAGTIGIPS